MIDRIKFYINDVNFDDISKCLDLSPIRVDRDESFIYGAKLKNLRVKYMRNRLEIEGSLHKYAKGNNYCLFTYEEAKNVLYELSICTGISLDRFIVTSIELGVNMQMKFDPGKYLNIQNQYQGVKFIPMPPLARTSKLRGCRCKLSEYEIKFYDKTFETIRSSRIKKEDRGTVPANILRYELSFSRKQLKYEGFTNVTGKNLLSPLHYSRFKKLMIRIFDRIVFDDILINYSEMLEEDVKRYIFVMSDKYDVYLQYLKEERGEREYRKEKRRKREFLKRLAPLTEGTFESELRSIFRLAISKI